LHCIDECEAMVHASWTIFCLAFAFIFYPMMTSGWFAFSMLHVKLWRWIVWKSRLGQMQLINVILKLSC
jgi:hypothetical protein